MRVTQDKFNETRYNYHKVKDKFEEIKSEKDLGKLIELILFIRYEINSFVNSFRATTFALQSEHRRSHGEKFEDWYKKSIDKINSDPFSKAVKELRNINQKQGNILPTFEFKGETDRSIIYFEINPTDPNNKFVTNIRMESKLGTVQPSLEILTNPEGTFSATDRRNILIAAAKNFGDQMNEVQINNNFRLHLVKIGDLHSDCNPDEFLTNLKGVGLILQDIVDDGWDKLQ